MTGGSVLSCCCCCCCWYISVEDVQFGSDSILCRVPTPFAALPAFSPLQCSPLRCGGGPCIAASRLQCGARQSIAVRYEAVSCSAVRGSHCSAVRGSQCTAVQASPIQCSAVQSKQVQFNAVQCSAVRPVYSSPVQSIQCSPLRCSATQCSAVRPVCSSPVQSIQRSPVRSSAPSTAAHWPASSPVQQRRCTITALQEPREPQDLHSRPGRSGAVTTVHAGGSLRSIAGSGCSAVSQPVESVRIQVAAAQSRPLVPVPSASILPVDTLSPGQVRVQLPAHQDPSKCTPRGAGGVGTGQSI